MAIGAGKRNITGTDAHDILVGLSRSDGRPITIAGGGGADTLIAGLSAITVDDSARNNTFARAVDIDDAALWSTAHDPLLGSAVAHTTVLGTGTGKLDWFSFTAEAGDIITLDVDFPRGISPFYWWTPRFELYRGDGSYVPGSTGGYGGQGIESTFPFERGLTLTVETTGTYVLKLGSGGSDHPIHTPVDPIPAGWSYLLTVAVTGHAAAAPDVVSGATLNGGDGGDVLIGSAVADTLKGGEDSDRLHAGAGDDIVMGDGGDDLLEGDAGDDTLTGGLDNDTLVGGEGRDILRGGTHKDALFGGAGDDWLFGGGNADQLTGDAGADTFLLTAPTGSGTFDTITDFAPGEDTVALRHRSFGFVQALGQLDASAFHLGATAQTAEHRILYVEATGALLFDADGAGGADAVQFASLTPDLALDAAAFVVV